MRKSTESQMGSPWPPKPEIISATIYSLLETPASFPHDIKFVFLLLWQFSLNLLCVWKKLLSHDLALLKIQSPRRAHWTGHTEACHAGEWENCALCLEGGLSLSPRALSSQTGGSRNGSCILGSLKLIDSHYIQFFLSFFFSLTPTHISELNFHTTPSRKPSCLPNLSWLYPSVLWTSLLMAIFVVLWSGWFIFLCWTTSYGKVRLWSGFHLAPPESSTGPDTGMSVSIAE